MKRVDDRTSRERVTHSVIVVMTDSFMSGWGEANGGVSYAGWACRPEHAKKVEWWVRGRKEAKRVRVVGNDWRPRGVGHAHIYVVKAGHVALS